jgi:hypothetical protein
MAAELGLRGQSGEADLRALPADLATTCLKAWTALEG